MRSKGFTIIELLIALFLFGILMSMIFPVAAFSMKTLKNIDKDVELQQQAQFIFDFMGDKIIDSTGLALLEDKSGSLKHNTNNKVYLKRIIFKNNHCDLKGYIFNLSKDLEYNYYNLKYGKGLSGSGADEVGNYIQSMEVEPIPADKKYIEADGIVLRINFILNGYESTFENSFHYRNSSGRF